MKNVTYDAKSHKKLGLHLSLEDTFLEKPQAGGGGGGGWSIWPPSRFRVKH